MVINIYIAMVRLRARTCAVCVGVACTLRLASQSR